VEGSVGLTAEAQVPLAQPVGGVPGLKGRQQLVGQLQSGNPGSGNSARATQLWQPVLWHLGNLSPALATQPWQLGNVNPAQATQQWQPGSGNPALATRFWLPGFGNWRWEI